MHLTHLILIGSFAFTNSANILGLFPLNVKSHYVMFERLLKELAERGHNVDVVTHFVSEEAPARYNQLSLSGTAPDLKNNLSVNFVKDFSHYGIVQFMAKTHEATCASAFQTNLLRDLRNSKKKYDLVITELFGSDCMLGFGYIFKAPVVTMTSSIALPWSNDRIANPDNPSYIPNYFVSLGAKMTLLERIENTVILLLSKFWQSYFTQETSNSLSREFFGADLPDLQELAQNISLILVNSHHSFSYARPTVPNFVEVGGLHIRDPKPLTQYYQEIIEDSKGVIYLSMGSMVLTETFEFDKLQGMFDAFAELPYKVLWRATKERFPEGLKIPANIHFEKYMPQMDILCHPNVKLFISHGGLMGTQEAIYCGVPQLGIPLFADQKHNVEVSQRMKMAVKVAYKDISKETVLNAARKLLEDLEYKKNVERVSREFRDRPITALDTGVFWVEYVMRHNGAPQLRSPATSLEWYQYYLIDVMLVLLSVFVIILYLFFIVLKFCVRVICKKKQKMD